MAAFFYLGYKISGPIAIFIGHSADLMDRAHSKQFEKKCRREDKSCVDLFLMHSKMLTQRCLYNTA